MKKFNLSIIFAAFFALMFFAFSNQVIAREQIRIVGSSTVYPFVTAVAERFGKNKKFKTPVVESTGTGGGFKLFCNGIGEETPDMSNASRPIKSAEKELCEKNGAKNITEIKIGYDAIVIGNSIKAKKFKLSKDQVFLALAKYIPKDGKLIENPYQKWSEIDKSLPDQKIEVYGPPPTSGTRDSFVEIVMEHSCVEKEEFKSKYQDAEERKKQCHLIREDGKYIEAGENDNLIIQKLISNEESLGVFGYSFLEQNQQKIQGSLVDGVEPVFDNITNSKYPVSRPLFVYLKGENLATVPGIKEFLEELVSDKAIGTNGYLVTKGLIPLNSNDLKTVQGTVKAIGK